MIARILSVLGVSPAALAWIGAAVAVLASAGTTGVLVHRYDLAQHNQVIATLEAQAAKTLAAETTKVLERERTTRSQLDNLEAAYAVLSADHAQALADGARLSSDLSAAVDRLRRGSPGRDGDRLPATAAGAGGCANLRAALDRAAGALELLQAAGDQAAADGQHAVDVATIAAQAARITEAGHD